MSTKTGSSRKASRRLAKPAAKNMAPSGLAPVRAIRYLVEDAVTRLELSRRLNVLARDVKHLLELHSDWRSLEAGLQGAEAHPARLMSSYLDQQELEKLKLEGLPWLMKANAGILDAVDRMEKEKASVRRLLATHW